MDGETDSIPSPEPSSASTGQGSDDAAPAAARPEPPVRLLIPASPRHLRLARVTASTMASELDFGLQDIEDLRVAVDELAALLIEDCPADAVLELQMQAIDGALRVTGEVAAPGLPAPKLHPVARELLDLLAGDYSVAPTAGTRSFELVKRSRSSEA